METKRVIIVGGGFAGINLAQKLSKNKTFEITLVDKNNYNFFPPLLYQVATGFLEASNISYPFRKFFQDKNNLRFSLGEFKRVIPELNKIETDSCELFYDYLVFATGTESNFFGMENVKKNSVPMKTVQDALVLRNHVLMNKEKATRTSDELERKKLLTIVVAGAGPTGVEVSGMLAEMNRSIFKKDYPELKREEAQVYLVDALPVVLNPMTKKSQEQTLHKLKGLGINVLLNHAVKDYVDDVVTFDNGNTIETKTLIWTSGVTATNLEGLPKEVLGKGKRVMVDGYNLVNGMRNIYAIGDICFMTADEKFPQGHPQLAQVAIQQAKNLSENLERIAEKKEQKLFSYTDKGTMAIIGVNKAVADLPGNIHFKGFIAYFMWLFVHLFSLIRYRNQVKTFYNWLVAFFTRDQSLRFIIETKPDK
ncbi:NAD(P)/FAD-dependent oxidoreductase [Dyadobacter psychrotolerans]|uniref:NADH:ubiquinone reductase (non-electrogenic) n=1 Tax=Dyadobacter psychrotolerans TaxID=2541721 RepID=A0A4V2Z462_9BACT|nr:NAD(P)/FAD-dependent oxidoreductase [Dyadobacter psychrotolerans]TDE15378.1 NAD(P)/FAD-dependent oxidoreductase [Dyadobacter psychrotolerans]